jgi:hypothetical protein
MLNPLLGSNRAYLANGAAPFKFAIDCRSIHRYDKLKYRKEYIGNIKRRKLNNATVTITEYV